MLNLAVAFDARLKSPDDSLMRLRYKSWTEELAPVEVLFAEAEVRRFYRGDHRDRVILPGQIRTAWVAATPPPAIDIRGRACRVRGCGCDHERCRDGWLDQETTVRSRLGESPAVVRCPACLDALDVWEAERDVKPRRRGRQPMF